MPLVFRDSCFHFKLREQPDTISFLEEYGYTPLDANAWKEQIEGEAKPTPELKIQVERHIEISDCTWYVMQCSLSLEDAFHIQWCPKRRCCHMRHLLHDEVKNRMGDEYPTHFASAPFAGRFSWPGTTERLDSWTKALAEYINTGTAPPSIVALTLSFLEPPDPKSDPVECNKGAGSDYDDFVRISAAVTSTRGDLENGSSFSTYSSTSSATKSSGPIRWWWWLLPSGDV